MIRGVSLARKALRFGSPEERERFYRWVASTRAHNPAQAGTVSLPEARYLEVGEYPKPTPLPRRDPTSTAVYHLFAFYEED